MVNIPIIADRIHLFIYLFIFFFSNFSNICNNLICWSSLCFIRGSKMVNI